MRRQSWYRGLAFIAIATGGSMAFLSLVALALAEGLAAGAAALCAVVLVVPGLFFLGYARRLYQRELALAHAGRLAESHGVVDPETLGKELHVSTEDATKILRTSIREGHARGEVNEAGVFVAASLPRCPACHTPLPPDVGREKCPSCGAALPAKG